MQNYSSSIHFMEDFFIFHSTGKNLRLQAEPLQPPPQSCYDDTWEGESGNIAKVLTRYTTSNLTLCG